MAFVIDETPGIGPMEFMVPSNTFKLADQTATSAVQTLGAAAKTFAWQIWLKAFTRSAGTVGPIFALQVADNVGFSTNVREIDRGQLAISASSQLGSIGPQFGRTPDGQKAFARILVVFSGSDSGTYDAKIVAA